MAQHDDDDDDGTSMFVTFTDYFFFIDATFHLKISLATFQFELGKHIHPRPHVTPQQSNK